MSPDTPQSKLSLRPIRPEDVELVFDWVNSPTVLGEFVSVDEFSKEMLVNFAHNNGKLGDDFFWVLVDAEVNRIGYAHAWPCDRYEDHMEFGRVLLPEYRGKGLGVSFLYKILEKIFSNTNADRVQAITASHNTAVLKNWQKSGIVVEGEMRDFMTLHDQKVNAFLGSMLRSEFQKVLLSK
jgi:RimJ/RimL family protein N-acetyltransferase